MLFVFFCNCWLWDVLTGRVSPSGKLPVTFPRQIEDTPCFHNFPGENEKVMYGEGIWIGYRHYEKAKVKPMFPFGFGLSYTSFKYSNFSISSEVFDGKVTVSADVTNAGAVRGKETVQFYVSQTSKPGLNRPIKELKGFDKVDLNPGETKTAKYTLDKYALGYFNDKKMKWIVDEDAQYEVHIAASSTDVRGSVKFQVQGSMEWIN
jgi:beta-glucosidase